MIEITGIVDGIRYRSEETGWTVLSLKPEQTMLFHSSTLTAVGEFNPEPFVDEELTLQGAWTTHAKFGEQFKVERIVGRKSPQTRDGLVAYLASGLFPGIGDVIAARIVDHFGDDTADVFNRTPQRLAEVSGITSRMIDDITEVWREEQDAREAMTYLCGLGLTTKMAGRIYSTYQDQTIDKVRDNPYRLAWDVDGIGFKRADEIARAIMNCSEADPRRIEAGILHALKDARKNGHVYLPVEELLENAAELLDVFDRELIKTTLTGMAARDLFGGMAKGAAVVVDQDVGPEPYAYLPQLHFAETNTNRRLVAIHEMDSGAIGDPEKLTELIDETENEMGLLFAPQQREAIMMALTSKVSVITGGPGTGKCVSGGTLVWTDRGLIPIRDLKPAKKMEPDQALPIKIRVKTRTGMKQASHFYYGGLRDTLKITTAEGFDLEGTPNHRVIVATKHGPDWKRLDEIQPDDYVAIFRYRPSYKFEFDNFAYFLGQFVGDGCATTKTAVVITTPDPETWDFLETEMPQMNYTVSIHSIKGQARAYRIGRHWWNGLGGVVIDMKEWGCKMTTSYFKRIPTGIMRGTYSQKRSFLMGLFDSDGSVDKRGAIELTLTSGKLIKEVQLLLLQFGIVANRTKRETVEAWRLTIMGDDARLFFDKIGFRVKRKQARSAFLPETSNANLDVVPCLGTGLLRGYIRQTGRHDRKWWWKWKREAKGERRPHRGRVRQLLRQYPTSSNEYHSLQALCDGHLYWAQVASVEASQTEVFDLHVPDGNEFVAGGFVNHNTTILRALTNVLQARNVTMTLCAPTGRAAKRMTETTGVGAATIHRTLQFKPGRYGGGSFEKNESDPLNTSFVLVDECSMVDIALFNNLLRAIPNRAHLLLVGDIDQLPSVGPGNVLRDLIDSGTLPVTRLDTIFRQSERSKIITNAHAINAGKIPDTTNDSDDFFFFKAETQEAIRDLIVEIVSQKLPDKFGYDPLHDVQVLAPMYRGDAGVNVLNHKLQEALNPPSVLRAEHQTGRRTFRVGDKVMQLKNNYELDVFNGDTGFVRAIDPEHKKVIVVIEGRDVTYEFRALEQLTHAFACTIHKSQGSEYPVVVMPVTTAHYIMLRRNLLYTGTTRGKKTVVLVGTRQAIAMAVNNAVAEQRYSALAHRLRRVIREGGDVAGDAAGIGLAEKALVPL